MHKPTTSRLTQSLLGFKGANADVKNRNHEFRFSLQQTSVGDAPQSVARIMNRRPQTQMSVRSMNSSNMGSERRNSAGFQTGISGGLITRQLHPRNQNLFQSATRERIGQLIGQNRSTSQDTNGDMVVILESPQKSGKKNNFSSTFHHPSQKGGTAALEPPFFYTDGPYQSMDNTFKKMDRARASNTSDGGVRVRSVLDRRSVNENYKGNGLNTSYDDVAQNYSEMEHNSSVKKQVPDMGSWRRASTGQQNLTTPRRERQKIIDYMEAVPHDRRYPYKPVKLLTQYNREADCMTKPWKNNNGDPSNGRSTMIDFITKQNKKDGKLAPNIYFKSEKKGGFPDAKMMCQSTLQSNRGPLYKISTSKIKGMIDSAIYGEKQKPGPSTYKYVEKGRDYLADRSGSFQGLCKSDVEQLLMINDVRIQNEGKPKPGQYNPVYTLTQKRCLIPNLNRDTQPKKDKKEREKTPHANFYKVDLKDDRKILSTRTKSVAMKFGDREVMKKKKIDRFIDTHEKSKQWVPGPSKYHYPTDKLVKLTSRGPSTIGFKFKGR